MPSKLYEQGLQTRREVLGAEYVDANMKTVDDFTAPLQEMLNEYCWGWAWNRPGLDRKTRSFMNIAVLSAMGKPELKLHLRGAINNGLTKEEIREALLHVAIYAGVPTAVDSFKVAKQVFKEMGID